METPDERMPLIPKDLFGSADGSDEQQEIQLGLIGVFQRAFLARQLTEMGFDRNVVEALMSQSMEPIENADQAIEIMFNPARHRFFAGTDIADVLVARVNDNKNCQICFHPAADHV